MSVKERREEIIRILRGTKQTTIPSLAYTLKASISTIKRDILALTVDERYPINTIQGNKGGIVLKDFSRPYKRILSLEQKRVLFELTQTVNKYYAEVLESILRAYG